MGTSNNNTDEVLKTNEKKKDICGIKIFMGASTGNMLVDNHISLDRVFRESEVLIATHCEEEKMIRDNYNRMKQEKVNCVPSDHPFIRDEEACFESSLIAIQFAKKYNSRLHILHISTEKELQLFSNMMPLRKKGSPRKFVYITYILQLMITLDWATRSNVIPPSKHRTTKRHCGRPCLMTGWM